MGEEHPARDEPAERLERVLREMEEAGLPRWVIERAVRRAKRKTKLGHSRPPASRPKLNTNPELDAWYD